MTTVHMTEVEKAAFFGRLQELIHALAPSKNDQVLGLIEACISEGCSTRSLIVGIGRHMGFNYRHVAKMLNDNAGSNPTSYRWQADPQGAYTLHPPNAASE